MYVLVNYSTRRARVNHAVSSFGGGGGAAPAPGLAPPCTLPPAKGSLPPARLPCAQKARIMGGVRGGVGLKVTLQREPGAPKEIILRYADMDEEIRSILEWLSLKGRRLAARDGDALRMLEPSDVLYVESVDEHTYAYTAQGVFGLSQSLASIAESLGPLGFFRCSKSMAVNLCAIQQLKSGDYGRIFATLQNGERILVSRRYAKALRAVLKGEASV